MGRGEQGSAVCDLDDVTRFSFGEETLIEQETSVKKRWIFYCFVKENEPALQWLDQLSKRRAAEPEACRQLLEMWISPTDCIELTLEAPSEENARASFERILRTLDMPELDEWMFSEEGS